MSHAPPSSNRSNRNTLFALFGVTLALATPTLQMALRPWLEATFPFPWDRFMSLWVFWIVALVVVGLAWVVEGIPPAVFGIRRGTMPLRARLIELILAVVFGVLVAAVVIIPSGLVREWLGAPPPPSVDLNRIIPFWVAFPAWVTAAFMEELLFRSYAVERLALLGMRRWVAGAVTVVAFTLLHLLAWDAVHVLTVVFPAGVALTALYLWRRSLLFVVVVHGVINAPLLLFPFIAPYL